MKNIQKIADDIFKAPSSDELLSRWLDGNATKNEDGTYSSFNQTVDINDIYKHIVKDGKLIIKFTRVAGNFDCVDAGLTTLEGCPEYIGGWFDCTENKLTSLKGFPKYIAGNVYIFANTKYFAEKEIRNICKVIGSVHTTASPYSKITSRIAEEIAEAAGSPFTAPSKTDLLERWLDNFEKNTDGSYSTNDVWQSVRVEPDHVKDGKMIVKFKKVIGSFTCYDCELTSLEGCPEEVGGYFDCSKNKLVSLKGAPKHVGKNFWCYNNAKQFTDEDVLKVCKVGGEIFTQGLSHDEPSGRVRDVNFGSCRKTF